MKNHDEVLLGFYTALIVDLCRYYPGNTTEWMRTQVHLHSIMEARGSKFFTIDLPAAGKHFDKCLSAGCYTRSGIPQMRARRKRWVIPRLFEGLYLRIFHGTGGIRNDVDLTAVSLLRQFLYAAKKVRSDGNSSKASKVPSGSYEVVKEFFDVEMEIAQPSLNWASDSLGDTLVDEHHLRDAIHGVLPSDSAQLGFCFGGNPEPDSNGDRTAIEPLLRLVQQVADLTAVSLGELRQDEVIPKHGPGAVSDQKEGESKYRFPHWPRKLELTFPYIEFALANESLFKGLDDDLWNPGFGAHEPPSKLIVVPKTQKAPRLIASEPIMHQWMQQGVARSLKRACSRIWVGNSIDYTDQSLSQIAVLQASAHGSGCSIDLSNASDRLSCWLVERIFRRNLSYLRAFHATRTRWVVNLIDKKSPRYAVLRKFAPMGSALTFPVQSIVYAIVSVACAIYQSGMREATSRRAYAKLVRAIEEKSRSVRVFGDDIIVAEEVGPLVIQCLTALGLKVNDSKTFVGGKFYESCGVDAYDGVDVTPTYFLQSPVESDPGSIASTVETSNNLHKCGLWNAASWCVDQVPSRLRNRLGIWSLGSGAFGLKSFVGNSLSHLKEVWNEDFQEWNALCLQVKSTCSVGPDEGLSRLLQYFTEAPSPEVLWVSGVRGRSRCYLKVCEVSASVYNS